MGPFGTNPVRIDSQGNHVEPVTGIEERITEVLRKHLNKTRRKPGKRPGIIHNVTACKGCAWEADTIDYAAHEAHVAAVVAQALQPSAAEQKLAAIRRLHFQRDGSEKGWCANCGLSWPCPTVAVLDSDDTPKDTL
jgi:hypothetical protein